MSSAPLKAFLDARPGASSEPVVAPRGTTAHALIYKVMGKMFAILSIKGPASVIVKCDPHLIEVLKGQYAGIGHRSHLDPRHWICVALDADVSAEAVERLAAGSYDLVVASLTRKQRDELASTRA